MDTDAKGMPLSLVRRTLQLQEKTVVRAMPSMMGTLVPTASMWGSRLNGTERPGSDEPWNPTQNLNQIMIIVVSHRGFRVEQRMTYLACRCQVPDDRFGKHQAKCLVSMPGITALPYRTSLPHLVLEFMPSCCYLERRACKSYT